MKDGRDPVGDDLPVAVEKRDIDREVDAGPRHHLPLERIAMQVHDARQHQQPTRVELDRAALTALADIADRATLHRERRFQNVAAEQGAAAFNENIDHDAALLLAGCEARDAASYLSRNSSIPNLRKSG